MADAARGPSRIEAVCQGIGTLVEIVIVSRFVDSNAPQDDAGMIPVAADHAADVIDRDLLPGFVADMLPAGNLFQNKESPFVAGIQEMPGLRIVRGAHDVALEIVPQDAGIAALGAAGHRLSDERKGLMTVEAAQLHDSTIQFEAVVGELCFAESNRAFVLIHQLCSAQKADMDGIEIRMREVPQFDRAEAVQVHDVGRGVRRCLRRRNFLRAFGDHTLAIAELHLQREGFVRCLEMLKEAIHIQGWMLGESIFGLCKNILNKRAGNDAQRNFAVDASESEVVDLMAKRWNIRPLGGVHIYSEHIFSAKVDVRCQIEKEWRVAAIVFAKTRAIDPDRGGGHDSLEVNENVV